MTTAKNKYGGLCAPRHGALLLALAVLILYGDLFGIAHTTRTALFLNAWEVP
jgi:hypothetical protein